MYIVKIQRRPLFSTSDYLEYLIYDKTRHPKRTRRIPGHQLPDHIKDAFTTGEMKVYAEAEFMNNQWMIGNIVEEQSW